LEIGLEIPKSFRVGINKKREIAKSRIELNERSINNLNEELNLKIYSATEKIINKEIPKEMLIIKPLKSSLK